MMLTFITAVVIGLIAAYGNDRYPDRHRALHPAQSQRHQQRYSSSVAGSAEQDPAQSQYDAAAARYVAEVFAEHH